MWSRYHAVEIGWSMPCWVATDSVLLYTWCFMDVWPPTTAIFSCVPVLSLTGSTQCQPAHDCPSCCSTWGFTSETRSFWMCICVCDCKGLRVRSSATCPATCDDNRINLIDCSHLTETCGDVRSSVTAKECCNCALFVVFFVAQSVLMAEWRDSRCQN